MLLEEPDREVTAEFDGPLFPLVEGHELILVLGIEHQVEGGCGVGEPALAKGLLAIIGWGGGVVHGCLCGSSGQPGSDTNPSYHAGITARTRLHPLIWISFTSCRDFWYSDFRLFGDAKADSGGRAR